LKYLFCGALVVFGAVSLLAHHSTTTIFDVSKKVTVTGTLTKVDWVNPHIVVLVEGKGESWKMESNPPSWFRRVNVGRADLAKAVGQTVTIEANPAKDGSLYGYMMKITFPDKTSLEIVDPNRAEDNKTAATK